MSSQALKEVVYTPRSELLTPISFVRGMFRDLAASRELAWRLFVRDLSAKYRQSLLGYVWAFVPPIVTTLTFVFLRQQGLLTTADPKIPYAAYVVIGMVLWQVFVEAIQCPLKAVTAAKPMLSKVQFPPEAILLAGVGEVLFSFFIRLVLLAAVFVWYRLIPPPSAALLPLAVAALLALGFMFGVLVTPIGVLYTDVTQALTVITTFWFFFTPVIYPVQEGGLAGLVARWNPVSPLLIAGRDWMTLGTTTHWVEFLAISGASILLLFFGWIFYRVSMPHLIARIGN